MGLSFGLAVRLFGPPKRSARVVLAFPADRLIFEDGTVADLARRAAMIARYVAPEGAVEPWIYARNGPQRLPDIRPRGLTDWINDWGSLRRKPLLTADAAPSTPLEALATEHELLDDASYDDISAGMRAIAEEAAGHSTPTFVVFYLWQPVVSPKDLARELDAASGLPVFWEFLEELDEDHTWSSVAPTLSRLREEAAHITNAHAYNGPYYDPRHSAFDFWLYSVLLHPFARWFGKRPRWRPA